ncbi:asparagine synthase (glutamine-hydrolyzing) [Vibrio gallaecicus]|uniref:asparagine synthase (glutamine-hydrolyzing) n=1 Tax=Vibrio gallaecicus TaxID=552386 RepID=UPI0010C9C2A9|nr:asparagine synthase (glutamine-hydrolyzing) [Vibrio gallaecicus]MDN3614827.1 asparagine synthase (glutamine-hydrolyzing) [Vibrio gallaecicus]
MCGISFYYSNVKAFTKEIRKSLLLTQHRGPDDTGLYETKLDDVFVGLGHNRLSIIDLSEFGSQPMHDTSGLSIVFNGEIYNHRKLRESLEFNGCKFSGSSDTEVILNLYKQHGIEAFSMLEGMFSVIIFNKETSSIHIARDSIGIKPIYYSENEDGFFVSSEIKGLKPYIDNAFDIDCNDIYSFFNTGFIYEPNTGFKNIKKIKPGSILTINLLTNEKEESKLKPLSNYNSNYSFEEKLYRAVNNQVVADVPLGMFFSGGADSSILAGVSNDVDLFFAEYSSDPSSDIDRVYSRKIAEHLKKTMIVHKFCDSDADVDQLINQVKFVAEQTEEPISDYTFWSTFQLSLAAKNSGYKVMLSGMGGDEAFAGYPRYHVLRYHTMLNMLSPILRVLLKFKVFPKSLDKKFARLVSYVSEESWGVAYSRLLGYFSREELKAIFGSHEEKYFDYYSKEMNSMVSKFEGNKSNKVKLAQYMDRFGFLSHNLTVSDKASMLASIELRVPLLDESLVAHGLNESSKNLINSQGSKLPLKTLLSKYIPKDMIDRPKTGFNPPIDTLIKNIGKERIRQELSYLDNVINLNFVNSLIDEHFNGENNNSYKIWQVLYFRFWHENVIKG